ncbi:hypothetical protein EBR43_13700, partial [bacterium]|nr:hypothetical protein [bacterium]
MPEPEIKITEEQVAIKTALDHQLTIALLLPINDKSHSLISNEIISAAVMAVNDTKDENVKIIPINIPKSGDGIRLAVSDSISKGANVIVGPISGVISKIIADEVSKYNNVLFVTLSNYQKIANYKNAISFGYFIDNQIDAIVEFAKNNDIHGISLLLPSSKLGGDLSLAFNSSATKTQKKGYDISIKSAEFFINTGHKQTIKFDEPLTPKEPDVIATTSQLASDEV